MQRVDCGGAERKRIAEDERLRMLVIAGGRRHENIVRIEESGQFIGIEGIASVEGVSGADDPIDASDNLRLIRLDGDPERYFPRRGRTSAAGKPPVLRKPDRTEWD